MKTTVSSEHSYCLGLLSAPQGEEASCVRVHVCVCAYVSVCTCAGDGTHRMSGLLCVCVRAHMCAGDGTHHACQGSSDVPRRAGGISHQGCGVPWRVSGLLMLGRFLPAPFTSLQRGLGPAGHQKPLVLQVRVFLASSSHCFSLLQHPTPLPSRKDFPGPWQVTLPSREFLLFTPFAIPPFLPVVCGRVLRTAESHVATCNQEDRGAASLTQRPQLLLQVQMWDWDGGCLWVPGARSVWYQVVRGSVDDQGLALWLPRHWVPKGQGKLGMVSAGGAVPEGHSAHSRESNIAAFQCPLPYWTWGWPGAGAACLPGPVSCWGPRKCPLELPLPLPQPCLRPLCAGKYVCSKVSMGVVVSIPVRACSLSHVRLL